MVLSGIIMGIPSTVIVPPRSGVPPSLRIMLEYGSGCPEPVGTMAKPGYGTNIGELRGIIWGSVDRLCPNGTHE